MVTRVLELIARPGKSEAVCGAIEFEVRPRLRALPGFVELVTLISEAEPRLIVLMTVWRSESAATRYAKDVCPHISWNCSNLIWRCTSRNRRSSLLKTVATPPAQRPPSPLTNDF